MQSNQGSLSAALRVAARDTHPPAHPFVLYLVEKYLGDSEFWLRFPSAFFGALCVPAMYLLGRRIFSKTEGLLAAAFTAVFWFPIYYSQEARDYSMLFFFSMVSMLFWFPWLRMLLTRAEKSAFDQADVVGYVLSATALIYTHHYGSLMVALQGLALFLAGIRCRVMVRVLLLYLPIGLLAVPVWMQAVSQYERHYLQWLEMPPLEAFTMALFNYFNRSEILKHLALIIIAIPLVHTVRQAWLEKKMAPLSVYHHPEGWTLFFWLVMPFVCGAFGTLFFKPMLAPHYLIVSAPAAYLLLARAIARLGSGKKALVVLGGLILAFSLFDLFALKKYYWKPTKQQWREAVAYVIDNHPQQPDALIIGCAYKPAWLDYYFRQLGSRLRVQLDGDWCQKGDLPRVSAYIEKTSPRAVWLIYAHHQIEKEFIDYFAAKFRFARHQPFIKAGAWFFTNDQPLLSAHTIN